MNKFEDEFYCPLNPNNFGIYCKEQSGCDKCGWNPVVAKERHRKLLEDREQLERILNSRKWLEHWGLRYCSRCSRTK